MNEQDVLKHLKDATDVKCEDCGSLNFREALLIKRISKILTGDLKDTIVPLPVIVCDKCGKVLDLMNK